MVVTTLHDDSHPPEVKGKKVIPPMKIELLHTKIHLPRREFNINDKQRKQKRGIKS